MKSQDSQLLCTWVGSGGIPAGVVVNGWICGIDSRGGGGAWDVGSAPLPLTLPIPNLANSWGSFLTNWRREATAEGDINPEVPAIKLAAVDGPPAGGRGNSNGLEVPIGLEVWSSVGVVTPAPSWSITSCLTLCCRVGPGLVYGTYNVHVNLYIYIYITYSRTWLLAAVIDSSVPIVDIGFNGVAGTIWLVSDGDRVNELVVDWSCSLIDYKENTQWTAKYYTQLHRT